MVFGGDIGPSTMGDITELWNGLVWTETNDLNVGRRRLGGSGTQTTSIAFGGAGPSTSALTGSTEEWNANFAYGAWSTGASLNAGRERLAAAGTQTAGLAFGGEGPPPTGATELYNGTAWAELDDLNTARHFLGGTGSSTSALAFGGVQTVIDNTESWNGTAWTEVNDLNTAKGGFVGSAGADNTSVLAFGGEIPPGTSTYTDQTESWNGTSWTEVSDLNTGGREGGGAGISNTSALAFGGKNRVSNTESWNGSSWTELNDLNNAKDDVAGTGTQTLALAFGGSTPPTVASALTESWNGTNWTNENSMNGTKPRLTGTGTTSAALAFGGSPVPSKGAGTEEWNGDGSATETITI